MFNSFPLPSGEFSCDGILLAHAYRSLDFIFSGHRIFRMICWHMLINACSLSDGVEWICHVSDPYSGTALTSEIILMMYGNPGNRTRNHFCEPTGDKSLGPLPPGPRELTGRVTVRLKPLLQISHSDECPCGTGPQPPNHILQSCPPSML